MHAVKTKVFAFNGQVIAVLQSRVRREDKKRLARGSDHSEQSPIAPGSLPTNQSVRKALGKCRKNLRKTQLLSVVRRKKLPILPLLFICRYIRCLFTTPDSLAFLSRKIPSGAGRG